MLRGSVMLTALLFSAPVLWDALVGGTVSVDTAVIRFLVALPVAGVLVGCLRLAFTGSDRKKTEQATE